MSSLCRKIKVELKASFILWVSLLFYFRPKLILSFVLAVTMHELGHISALFIMKRPPLGIQIGFFGAEIKTGLLSPEQEKYAAAAGPGFSFLLGLFYPLFPLTGRLSLILGTVNLLPFRSLDGGRILRSILEIHLPADKADRICKYAEITACILICLLSLALYTQLGFLPVWISGVILLRNCIMNTEYQN